MNLSVRTIRIHPEPGLFGDFPDRATGNIIGVSDKEMATVSLGAQWGNDWTLFGEFMDCLKRTGMSVKLMGNPAKVTQFIIPYEKLSQLLDCSLMNHRLRLWLMTVKSLKASVEIKIHW